MPLVSREWGPPNLKIGGWVKAGSYFFTHSTNSLSITTEIPKGIIAKAMAIQLLRLQH